MPAPPERRDPPRSSPHRGPASAGGPPAGSRVPVGSTLPRSVVAPYARGETSACAWPDIARRWVRARHRRRSGAEAWRGRHGVAWPRPAGDGRAAAPVATCREAARALAGGAVRVVRPRPPGVVVHNGAGSGGRAMTGSDTGAGPGRPRVFSGIQPSGDVHLGNYLGAIKRWVRDQDRTESFFCLVDLHALTAPQDPEALRARTRSLCALLLAAGLVPSRSTLFVQSHVPAHAEACWLLNCVTPLGWLHRMTQYKDRAARHESVTTGLLDYPVLMAADILLYRADEVPVGEDQRQHVELARDIAARFNRLYGETLRVPTAVVPEAGARVMGLDDPLVKMSKSLAGRRGHAIRVLDGPDEIRRTVMGAVTDPG